MHNYKLSGNAFEPRATKIYENSNVINVGKAGRIASLAAGAVLYSFSTKGIIFQVYKSYCSDYSFYFSHICF